MSYYKTNYFNLIILILTIISLVVIGFYLGTKVKQTRAELGGSCPTVVQALEAKCNCPERYISIAGCTNGITGISTVKVDATKVILDNKIYNVSDITNSSVKSTPAPIK